MTPMFPMAIPTRWISPMAWSVGLCALFVVLLTAPVRAQDVAVPVASPTTAGESVPAGVAAGTTAAATVLVPPTVAVAWEGVRDAVRGRAEADVFDGAISRLIATRDAVGARNLETASIALSQWAQRALMAADYAAAARLADAAVSVAPDTPEGYLVQAAMHWHTGQYMGAVTWTARGAQVGLAHYWVGFAWVSYLLIVLWIAAASTLVLFLLPGMSLALRTVHHLLLELAGFRLPSMLVLLAALSTLVLPLVAGLGVGWLLLFWAAMAWAGDPTRFRRAQVFLLIAVLGGPWAAFPLANLTEPDSGAAKVALAESRGVVLAEPLPDPAQVADGDWRVAFALGNAALREAAYDDAVAWYQRAQTLGGNADRAQHNIGAALYRDGQVTEAGEIFRTLSQQPDPAVETLYNLGTVESQLMDFAAAREVMDRAQTVDPGGYLRLTRVAESQGINAVVPIGVSAGDSRAILLSHSGDWGMAVVRIWELLFAGIPVKVAPVLLVLIVAVFLLGRRWFERFRVYPCDLCQLSVCQDCIRFIGDLHLCSPCAAEMADTRISPAQVALIRQRHRHGGGLPAWLVRMVPGLMAFQHGRFGLAAWQLLFVLCGLWWIVLLDTVPTWALGIQPTGWPVERLVVGLLVAVTVLVVFVTARVWGDDGDARPGRHPAAQE